MVSSIRRVHDATIARYRRFGLSNSTIAWLLFGEGLFVLLVISKIQSVLIALYQLSWNRRVISLLSTMPKCIAHRFIRLPEVAKMVGVSKGTIYNWMHKGTFPKSISLGPQIVVCLESDVNKWIENKLKEFNQNYNNKK